MYAKYIVYYHYHYFAVANNINEFIKSLEEEKGTVIVLFKTCKMIVNPDNFQTIAVKQNFKMLDTYPLNIMNEISPLKHKGEWKKCKSHALRIPNDYESANSTLLNKSKGTLMEVTRLFLLALEVSKSLTKILSREKVHQTKAPYWSE